jgi:3-deoxy-D-manno-octulosonic-acid transferase
MNTFVYNIIIHLFYLMVCAAAPFYGKARQWVAGRLRWRNGLKGWKKQDAPVIWFHAASLGEFEQGRPLMEAIKEQIPQAQLVISFFSPSGFEIRKNYPLASRVCYLPLDTAYNAKAFLSTITPDMAFFIKYEFWHHYLNLLSRQSVPVYLVSAIMNNHRTWLPFLSGWQRKNLRLFTHIFVQDVNSADLLHKSGLNNVTVAGDTRFDRVVSIAGKTLETDYIKTFIGERDCVVAGSTWPIDERMLRVISQTPAKLIIVPHEVNPDHIAYLLKLFSEKVVLYSRCHADSIQNKQVLIIDRMGMLSSLYKYAHLAYVGGGFGRGIHNILEAAVYGIPVMFGPRYTRFREANEMVQSGAAFPVRTTAELSDRINYFLAHPEERNIAGQKAATYVRQNTGATQKILQIIFNS